MPGDVLGAKTFIDEYKKREERNFVLGILSIIAGALSVVLHPWIMFPVFGAQISVMGAGGLALMMIPFALAVAAFAMATIAYDTHKLLAIIGGLIGGLVFLTLLAVATYVLFFVFI